MLHAPIHIPYTLDKVSIGVAFSGRDLFFYCMDYTLTITNYKQ